MMMERVGIDVSPSTNSRSLRVFTTSGSIPMSRSAYGVILKERNEAG